MKSELAGKILAHKQARDVADGVSLKGSTMSDPEGSGQDTYTFGALEDKFGLRDMGDVGDGFNLGMMEGSEEKGDGTFQLGDSGMAYMDEGIWEKARNSDETWESYAKVYGQDAMEKKREGNEEGLSASAFDGLMDKLFAGKKEDAPSPEGKPMARSFKMAHSKAMLDADREFKMDPANSPFAPPDFKEASKPRKSFAELYSLNLKKRMYPETDNPRARFDAAA